MQVNEYTISFTGKTAISGELNRGYDYEFTVKAAIPKAEITDNEDGTVDMHYKAKLIEIEVKNGEKQVKSVASKNWSESQKTRWALKSIGEELAPAMDSEEFYKIAQQAIRTNLEEIINNYVKLS